MNRSSYIERLIRDYLKSRRNELRNDAADCDRAFQRRTDADAHLTLYSFAPLRAGEFDVEHVETKIII